MADKSNFDVRPFVKQAIKEHPAIEFFRERKEFNEYWYVCTCGHSTRHFKSRKSAITDLKRHIQDEVKDLIIEDSSK